MRENSVLAALVLASAGPFPLAAQTAPSVPLTLGAPSSQVGGALPALGASAGAPLFPVNGLQFAGALAPSTILAARAIHAVVNDEGVPVAGRAAEYYREVRKLVAKYDGRLDLSESLDVMDDSYADVWAKLKALEILSGGRGVERPNTHLEKTLTWVDGLVRDGGRTVAVHTHRVYFHRSQNPRSEIEEGIRRVDRYLQDALALYNRGGKAEAALGGLDEVVLVFETRGYGEIKEHLKAREAEVTRALGRRFRFAYLDELADVPKSGEQMRAEFSALARKHHGRTLERIVEGIVYSRYVGLLLELRTIDHLISRGYALLQSGRELFDQDGKYVTELDAVVRSPDGKVSIVEAKSARVPIPVEEAVQDKVLAKLDAYAKHRAELDAAVGGRFDEVLFSFDVGNNRDLELALRSLEPELGARYGFPVRFLFLETR